MMNGYVIIPRSILDQSVFANSQEFKVYIWCIIKATHKVKHLSTNCGKGTTTVTLKIGEFLYGRNSCSDQLNIPGTTLDRRLESLMNAGLIKRTTYSSYSVIRVLDYPKMQNPANYRKVISTNNIDNKRAMNCQQMDTNNNYYTHNPYD